MTARVIVTDVADLVTVLDELDRAAARHGWRVIRPMDAAELADRARRAQGGLRMPAPLTVTLEADPAAASSSAPIDAAVLLARTPVRGAVVDAGRGLHRG
ncbi:hypothetical protein [Microbacterium oleivorans]|uniref:Uncharacterized protein n=1 Tax=Microbacterium oleivorans TaxID=273677 RepID=A0A7D5EYY4_9MICO|nr:hypothetical protein [Microbacterium oleivorans]QLD12148.1 hypothetical protein HW566_10435 [Microbacterium oleivorans]